MSGSGSVPLGGRGSTNSTDVMLRIEANTAETARWIRYLTIAVVVLIIVTGLLFV
jgi:hypothetical protein